MIHAVGVKYQREAVWQ